MKIDKLRADFQVISNWVEPNSSVLDLGCGDGSLLNYLIKRKQVTAYGVEIDDHNIVNCIQKGVNVIKYDIKGGLNYFPKNAFDYVIMSQTLQAIRYPDLLLKNMLKVGKECIVTFPNFAHWYNRYQLLVLGKMPVSKALPHSWYNTKNIHLCTVKDFEQYCKKNNIAIKKKIMLNAQHKTSNLIKFFPNLFAEIALYRLHLV